MTEREINSFEEFWPFYVEEHSQPATRALHFVGTAAAIVCAVMLAINQQWRWLPLALVPGYAAAWVGHFLVEKNRPATFRYPLWSFLADQKMFGLMLAGKMDEEIARLRQHKYSPE